MGRVYGAGTIPVNEPNEPLQLTRDQLWQALQRKIRRPEEFVPILSSCKVHSDKDGVVEREVTLDFGRWGKRPMQETVTTHGDLWIRFAQAEGSVSTNLISYRKEVIDSDLMLTYIFEWDWADIEEGSAKHAELEKEMSIMAVMGVVKSCERARELVKEGLIK